MAQVRKLLFSVTAKDCDWAFSKGTGPGGQAKNKGSAAVHCHHRASGARAFSQAGRSQEDNKRDAFVKMCNTKEFKDWHRREVWKHLGILEQIERSVAEGMHPENLRMEIKIDGKWVEVPLDAPLDISVDGEDLIAKFEA